MRIYVDLVLFLYASSVCGFSNRQVMERTMKYIDDRINAESKLRQDDFGTLLSEIGAIKTMLQQLQETKSENENTDSTEATRKRQETYNLIDNAIPEIQTNILDLQEQFEQAHTAVSKSLDKIRNDMGEMKNRVEHLKDAQEKCLEDIRTNSKLTVSLQEKLISGEITCSAGKYPITTEKVEQKCNCTVFSCPVISTPSTESPVTNSKSSTSPINLDTSYKSCLDLYRNGFKSSGVYGITIEHKRLTVYCDMTTDGGGWTVFQRRQDGSVDFYRDWNNYKTGFGDLTGEFWLGNEYLNLLTDNNEPHELRIELEDHAKNRAYAKYSSFKVRSESMNYKLEVSGYTGTAGDSLFSPSNREPLNEMAFSTKDKDNDKYSGSCASAMKAGWWFNNCSASNLNGPYQDKVSCWNCIVWTTWKGFSTTLTSFTEMKVR